MVEWGFVEDVERLEGGRQPGDIDVVSFTYQSEVIDEDRARFLTSVAGHWDIKARLQID